VIDLQRLLLDLAHHMPCRMDTYGHCQEHRWFEVDRPCPQVRIIEILAEPHVVELRETEFGLQHTVACRGSGPRDLMDCPVNEALHALSGPPRSPGTYEVYLEDGELRFEAV
jgi:hypothetical protein